MGACGRGIRSIMRCQPNLSVMAVSTAWSKPRTFTSISTGRVMPLPAPLACTRNVTPEPVNVPNHGDYRVGNWLVDRDDVLRVIDFGNARWAPPAADLSALAYGPWWDDPGAREAFARGYGEAELHEQQRFVVPRLGVRAA